MATSSQPKEDRQVENELWKFVLEKLDNNKQSSSINEIGLRNDVFMYEVAKSNVFYDDRCALCENKVKREMAVVMSIVCHLL